MSNVIPMPTLGKHGNLIKSVLSTLVTALVLYYAAIIMYQLFTGLSNPPTVFIASFVLGYLLMGAVHELGHALMGRKLGLKVRRVNVRLLSLSVTMEGERTNGKQFFISLAGPLAHAALALLVLAAASLTTVGTDLHGTLLILGYLGLLEVTFSTLLPIRRSDGAKALRTGYHCLRGRGGLIFIP